MNQRSLLLFAVEFAMALWAEAYRQTGEARLKCTGYGLTEPSRRWCWNRAGDALYKAQIPRIEDERSTGIGMVGHRPVKWRRVL
jgi:hypothetical protein